MLEDLEGSWPVKTRAHNKAVGSSVPTPGAQKGCPEIFPTTFGLRQITLAPSLLNLSMPKGYPKRCPLNYKKGGAMSELTETQKACPSEKRKPIIPPNLRPQKLLNGKPPNPLSLKIIGSRKRRNEYAGRHVGTCPSRLPVGKPWLKEEGWFVA